MSPDVSSSDSSPSGSPSSDASANEPSWSDLEREIRTGRTFSIADVIAQEGGSFLKGESPIPRPLQAEAEIRLFIDRHLPDSSGAMKATLRTWIRTEPHLSQNLDTPLLALRELLTTIVQQPSLLHEFVRQVDMHWGQLYNERPFFQKPGQPAHPDDEYTHASVHIALSELLAMLEFQLQTLDAESQ